MQPPDREARAMRNLRITSESRASAEDAAVIHDGLARFNVAATKHTYYSPVAIFLRDERDAVLGGALGDVWGGWLDLVYLWIAEPLRGQGYGERLLRATEDEARPTGAKASSLRPWVFRHVRSTNAMVTRSSQNCRIAPPATPLIS